MIHFQLVSTAGTQFDGEVYEVVLPTTGGSIAVYSGHMPLMATADAGVISVRSSSSDSDDNLKHFATGGGLIQTDGHSLTFLADDVAQADDIKEEEAASAVRKAEQLIKDAKSPVDLHEARQMLQRSSARLHVAKLKKRRH